jgi:epoxide hydrolase 4
MPEPIAARIPELRHEFADVNGLRLHYAASGAGKLILFLHGFPEFWYEWKNQLADFGRDHFAVAPDQRGYNLSSKPPQVENYGIRNLVADVAALVHHLGAKSCILVGHDWGGAVAYATAIALPQLVEKLVIINAPHPAIFRRLLNSDPAQQQASQYMLMFQTPAAEPMLSANNFTIMRDMVFKTVLEQGHLTEDDWKEYLKAWSQPGAITGGLNYYRAAKVGPATEKGTAEFAGMDQMPSLQVNVPTLVIWGEKDVALMPSNLEGLDAYIPNLRIERVPDAGHWVVHERPALVNSLIHNFIGAA